MRDEQNDPLDGVIDEIARSLTRSDPPSTLRTQVAARTMSRSHRTFSIAWAVGAAAAVVIAAVLLWSIPEDRRNSEREASGISTDPPQSQTFAGAGDGANQALPGSTREGERARATAEPVPLVVPEPLEPLTIETIDVNAMAIDELDVPMLTVEVLTLEPLTPLVSKEP